MVRCGSVGGLNIAAHLNVPSVVAHHRPGKDRIAQGLPATKWKSPWCAVLHDIYAFSADPKICPNPALQGKRKERHLSQVNAMPTHLARKCHDLLHDRGGPEETNLRTCPTIAEDGREAWEESPAVAMALQWAGAPQSGGIKALSGTHLYPCKCSNMRGIAET